MRLLITVMWMVMTVMMVVMMVMVVIVMMLISDSALVQFSSVVQWCPTLCDPVNCRPPCPSPVPGVYPDSCPLSW